MSIITNLFRCLGSSPKYRVEPVKSRSAMENLLHLGDSESIYFKSLIIAFRSLNDVSD